MPLLPQSSQRRPAARSARSPVSPAPGVYTPGAFFAKVGECSRGGEIFSRPASL
ncbi:hypothetical protein B8V81_0831 [Paenibacillus pasadenensis]|uniref:Uncharacterized protein n=1 Tax=Paenibacillus pasadenensis TaxID=217090 RepID=A0A2N5N8C8_9BACL|nr:hypothetical protein B8V81_0831 [Paenibacillus pasadenensis]